MRNQALRVAKKMYDQDEKMKSTIDKFAMIYLKMLEEPLPPANIVKAGRYTLKKNHYSDHCSNGNDSLYKYTR